MSEKVVVIGAGTMGCGVAALWAMNGHEVVVYDPAPAALDSLGDRLAGILGVLVEHSVLPATELALAVARVDISSGLEIVRDATFVVESAPEDLCLKLGLFAEIERLVPPDAIIATNTSSLEIALLSTGISRPERFLATHYYYPAEIVPLVEIVRGPATSDWAVSRTEELLTQMGKVVVYCRDSPGYIASRIQMVLILEAINLLQDGVASAEDIDKAVRASFGPRITVFGALETVDRAGLDIYHKATQNYAEALGDRFLPPRLLCDKVACGELGVKMGCGLTGDAHTVSSSVRTGQLIELFQHLGLLQKAGHS